MLEICLTMIVKDEAAVIARCLASARPLIDRWCIVDTGSTDATEEVVRAALAGVPGTFYRRPWRGFGANRTEALELARADAPNAFALIVDADDVLEIDSDGLVTSGEERAPGLSLAALRARHEIASAGDVDGFMLEVALGSIRYHRMHLLRLNRGWRYEGVLHEYPTRGTASVTPKLTKVRYRCVSDGARSQLADEVKYRRDAETLMAALETEPDNARYVFYAAQSWRDAGEPELALELYDRRARMTNGFFEEVFVSLLEIAKLHDQLDHPDEDVWAAYLRAHAYRPVRIEALYELTRFCRLTGQFALAWVFASAAYECKRPTTDVLFIAAEVYTWRMLDEYALAAYHTGRHARAIVINSALLDLPELPDSERPRIQKNLDWALGGKATP